MVLIYIYDKSHIGYKVYGSEESSIAVVDWVDESINLFERTNGHKFRKLIGSLSQDTWLSCAGGKHNWRVGRG